ncbi:TetR/AcrR family transcriptional regulator [Streptomyces sp. NBC_01275]|uniref:TetR/AcrR family transcriptional regulator n=1 Tax=Streptomyces sp. NBC_01275 TaxID=2903807 RepID=UPI00225A540A|nr:TetR/AcrR family transcriptional regulator [Streptomyces sp. NBC_01275]MCX4763949.1 TetR/AcrR family transcriptional regulator [Streptomyces sp. NBC_01275]
MRSDAHHAMRARLLDCALDMVAEGGVEALSLRAIARRARVSHGSPLRHFSGRAELLSAVASEGYRRLADRSDNALRACGAQATPAQRLRAVAFAYVEFGVANPGLHELMARHDLLLQSDPELGTLSRSLFEKAVELVRDRQQDECWHSEIESSRLTAVLWAALEGFTHLWLINSIARAAGPVSLNEMVALALQALDIAPRVQK